MAKELSMATSHTKDDSTDFYWTWLVGIENRIHHPLCHRNDYKRESPELALDLEITKRKFSGSCRCFAKQIKFYHMIHHYKSYKMNLINKSERSTSDNTKTYQENTILLGIPPLSVPCVKNHTLPDSIYLDHCNYYRLFQIVPVMCPLCVSLPGGDSSQITTNFLSWGAWVSQICESSDEESQY
ncbi:unnamed protein product [Nyctereutes procyonoides]|uniref:(raccoon dog) hypothetical protein n=1 Tax=Nyctereutes procyonoides TaxID=34880 RepID=A0A811YCW6_NYCPR|nr:unnamed protein product [Nyctereutes procyonoides]